MDHVFVYARDPHTGAAINNPMNNPHERYRAGLKADLRAEAIRQTPFDETKVNGIIQSLSEGIRSISDLKNCGCPDCLEAIARWNRWKNRRRS